VNLSNETFLWGELFLPVQFFPNKCFHYINGVIPMNDVNLKNLYDRKNQINKRLDEEDIDAKETWLLLDELELVCDTIDVIEESEYETTLEERK